MASGELGIGGDDRDDFGVECGDMAGEEEGNRTARTAPRAAC